MLHHVKILSIFSSNAFIYSFTDIVKQLSNNHSKIRFKSIKKINIKNRRSVLDNNNAFLSINYVWNYKVEVCSEFKRNVNTFCVQFWAIAKIPIYEKSGENFIANEKSFMDACIYSHFFSTDEKFASTFCGGDIKYQGNEEQLIMIFKINV